MRGNTNLPFENALGKVFLGDLNIKLDDIEFIGGLGIFLEHIAKDHRAGKQTLTDFFVILKDDPL